MRVILLNQYYAPDEAATAQLLADLGHGLAAAGHEVTAICCNRSYQEPAQRYPRRQQIDGVEIRRVRSTGFGRTSRAGRLVDYATFLCGAANALIWQRRPDVVVSLSTPPMVALLGLLMSKLRRARSVYWVMDVYPDLAFELGVLDPDTLLARVFRRFSSWILRRSDRVIALGETMAKHLTEAGAAKVTVIHNWADGDAIRPLPIADHPLRDTWGWSDKFVVLYSGNMGLAHEFDTVLDAAAQLGQREDILFAFVGGGPRRDAVEAEARRRGLTNVEFRPYVPRDQLNVSLTAGDVHLVSLREGLPGLLVPSKIYGVLAAGRPCIYVGPNWGEIASIVAGGQCGQRVACGDASGLVAAITGYADDGQRQATDGQSARAWFEQQFTRDHGVAAFKRVIE